MFEAIKHIFGVCGDGHPSLMYLFGLTPIFIWCKNTVRVYYTSIILTVKTLLKRFQ